MHVRTCRRLLGVREDTPDELLKLHLQVLDSRITHDVVRATASWQDLESRAGSFDASRLFALRFQTCRFQELGLRTLSRQALGLHLVLRPLSALL